MYCIVVLAALVAAVYAAPAPGYLYPLVPSSPVVHLKTYAAAAPLVHAPLVHTPLVHTPLVPATYSHVSQTQYTHHVPAAVVHAPAVYHTPVVAGPAAYVHAV